MTQAYAIIATPPDSCAFIGAKAIHEWVTP